MSNYILSIDVGIVRLAFALFKRVPIDSANHAGAFILDKWSVVNLTKTSDAIPTCSMCAGKAKYCTSNKELHYCLKHSKKTNYFLPSPELKPGKINKLKLDELASLAIKLNVPFNSSSKKTVILDLIRAHLASNMLIPIIKTNASELDLNTIGRNIKQNFDSIFAEHVSSIDEVIIENQLGPQAIRMKTIQGMLSQYFIMKNDNVKVRFVNASNKLKNTPISETKEENTYKDRKELSIHLSKQIIETNVLYRDTWHTFIKDKKKVDGLADLADCFLQGIWYIEKNNA